MPLYTNQQNQKAAAEDKKPVIANSGLLRDGGTALSNSLPISHAVWPRPVLHAMSIGSVVESIETDSANTATPQPMMSKMKRTLKRGLISASVEFGR